MAFGDDMKDFIEKVKIYFLLCVLGVCEIGTVTNGILIIICSVRFDILGVLAHAIITFVLFSASVFCYRHITSDYDRL